MVLVALVFGVMLVTPIGGADMPTVISLLNSYAGFSAALLGFVLNSKVLVVAGALDGSSGFHSVRDHVQGDEPLVYERDVRRIRAGANFGRGADRGEDRAQRVAGRGCWNSGRGEQGGYRSGLRHGGGAGAAQSAGTVRHPDQEGRGREPLESIPSRAECRGT